ncbi:MAG: HupE/UreJ family protein [Pseudomonadota bacterium]
MRLSPLAAALTLLASTPASASASGVEGEGGFMRGLLHPALGFEHFMAMAAVGLLSVQLGGRALLIAPATLFVFLTTGGALGAAGVPFPEIRGAAALSILAIGLAIAMRTATPQALALLVVGVFALLHGHAHFYTAPYNADPPGPAAQAIYAAGFLIGSAALHLLGVGIGLLQNDRGARALLGAGVAGVGLHIALLTFGVV